MYICSLQPGQVQLVCGAQQHHQQPADHQQQQRDKQPFHHHHQRQHHQQQVGQVGRHQPGGGHFTLAGQGQRHRQQEERQVLPHPPSQDCHHH